MKRQGLFAPLVVAALLATGVCVVWGLLFSFLWSVGETLNPSTTPYENLGMTTTGEPFITTSERESPYRTTFRTLDGEMITKVNPYNPEYMMPPPSNNSRRTGNTWWWRLQAFYIAEPVENWFFFHDGAEYGHGYFVGYDQKSKQLLGYISTNGLSPNLPDLAHQFSIPYDLLAGSFGPNGAVSSSQSQSPTYEPRASDNFDTTPTKVHIIVKDKLLEVSLNQRTVRELAQEPNAFAVCQTTQSLESPSGVDNLQIDLRNRASIVFPADGSHPRREIPIPNEIQDLPCTVIGLSQNELLLIGYERTTPTTDYKLYWLDDQGRVTRQRAVAVKTGNVEVSPQLVWAGTGFLVPSPLSLALLATIVNPQQHLQAGNADSYGQVVTMNWKQCWPIFLLVTIGSLALAETTRRRHRQLGQDYGWIWFIFVFLFGAPGIFGYLFHRSWPVLEECTSCRQPVPHDRDRCRDCSVVFRAPSRLGIEVMERVEGEAWRVEGKEKVRTPS